MKGAAFPMQFLVETESGGLVNDGQQTGLSKREWFAGQALVGLLAACGGGFGHHTPAKAASLAVQHADALIAELAKENLDA